MKKLFTQIVKKNGELKDVYVCVDDETARVLEQVDEETRHTYLQEEYKMFMADYRYKRRNQSLEKSVDNGFDVIDEKQDVEEMAIKEADMQRILEAKGMIGLRKSIREILDMQIAGCSDEQLKIAQWELNERYDRFVNKY